MPKVPLFNLSQEEINIVERQRERDKRLISWAYGQARDGVTFNVLWDNYVKEVMKITK